MGRWKKKDGQESFLVTIQYERDKGRAEDLAKEIAEKGHTANVAQHQELYEPANPDTKKVVEMEEEKHEPK